jgi:hypothetical protein
VALTVHGTVRAAPPDPAALLTDAKVKAFIVYLRAASSGVGGVGAGMISDAAPQAAQGERPTVDVSGAGMQDLGAAARKGQQQSGLSQAEIKKLTEILAPYYGERVGPADAAQALKAGTGSAALAAFYRETVEKGEKVRAEFARKYGEAALRVVDAHEAEYLAVQQEMVERAMRPQN